MRERVDENTRLRKRGLSWRRLKRDSIDMCEFLKFSSFLVPKLFFQTFG